MKKPIYLQIKEKIEKEVQYMESNEPIESERQLSKRFGASRMTIRKAIDALVEDGILYREEKKGTFVADKSLRKENTTLINQPDGKVDYRLVNYDIKSHVEEEILKKLKIDPNDTYSIIRAIRIVFEDKEPQRVEEFYICRSYVDEKDVNNFDKIMNLNYYLKDNTIKQKFIPMIIPPKYATLLGLSFDQAIIIIEGIVKSKSAKPIIYYQSYNNPEVRTLEMTL
ncbi:MAG: GntR family transcriptional regulator [Atopostipes suicloacalis]|nr:GntR family transcriptional regulator [Atopostipes suicloacalis]